MVKVFISVAIFFTTLFAAELDYDLDVKIKSFLDEKTYTENKKFIDVIFNPPEEFYLNDRVNAVRVIQTLKENGLLNLFFASPRELKLEFKTNSSPLFFMKIMEDTLRSIGYYRYVTNYSKMDSSEFSWEITLFAEYATDPIILDNALSSSGCSIVDIQRISIDKWIYTIDMTNGYLNTKKLQPNSEYKLKHSLDAVWLDISEISSLSVRSSIRNRWYPYLAYYDSSLHLLKLVKKENVVSKMRLDIPNNAKYLKITDNYNIKNIKDELILKSGALR
jgi:hypothetical protein